MIATHVIPGPAVKAAVLNVRGVVGNKIVAERVAFVGGSPKFAGLGIHRQPDRIANAGREDAQPRAVRIVFKNIRPMKFSFVGVRVVAFEPYPTETNIFLPSGENATSRVECP